MVSSVACFRTGHRAIYNSQFATLGAQLWKLCRSIVGPPPEVDWNAAWGAVLDIWNERVKRLIPNAHANSEWNLSSSGALALVALVLHVSNYSGVSKPKFLIPIERQVNQQYTNTNASIVVGSAATMWKRQSPKHIMLPEHSRHIKFRSMGSAKLFGWEGPTTDRSNRRKWTSIVYSVQIGFVIFLWPAA